MASLADARWRLLLLAIALSGCGGVTAANADAGFDAPELTTAEGCNQVA
jgi:hypothetical protein